MKANIKYLTSKPEVNSFGYSNGIFNIDGVAVPLSDMNQFSIKGTIQIGGYPHLDKIVSIQANDNITLHVFNKELKSAKVEKTETTPEIPEVWEEKHYDLPFSAVQSITVKE